MQRQRRNQPLEYGVILIMFEIMQMGLNNIPLVTLLTVGFQVALYIGLINVPWQRRDVCISASKILKYKEWRSFIFSTVEHADDMHLYYNMGSFILKGRMLERKYGSLNFALLLCIIAAMTNTLYVFLGKIMSEVSGDISYESSCAIGFSGVIFALKVLTTTENPSQAQHIFGFFVPGKYSAWAELLVIHFLNPNASFIGHLAGIIAGIIYCKTAIGALIDYVLFQISGVPMCHGVLSYEDYIF